jgi:hypothetical protein
MERIRQGHDHVRCGLYGQLRLPRQPTARLHRSLLTSPADRGKIRFGAQKLPSEHVKIIRYQPLGSIPAGQPTAEFWSIGSGLAAEFGRSPRNCTFLMIDPVNN